MKSRIIPSIIARSQGELNRRISKVSKYFSLLQLDVMDGDFVGNKSFDFDFKLPKGPMYEAQLMVRYPVDWIDKYGDKVDTVIFHVEPVRDNVVNIIKLIRKKKARVGIAIKPRTKVAEIKPYLGLVDMVLVMTVKPGHYGGKFLSSTLEKVEELRRMKPKLDIEVDGGISNETILGAHKSGANMFVCGSYLQKSKNIKRSLNILELLLGKLGSKTERRYNGS